MSDDEMMQLDEDEEIMPIRNKGKGVEAANTEDNLPWYIINRPSLTITG
jgi:hypothetical protein